MLQWHWGGREEEKWRTKQKPVRKGDFDRFISFVLPFARLRSVVYNTIRVLGKHWKSLCSPWKYKIHLAKKSRTQQLKYFRIIGRLTITRRIYLMMHRCRGCWLLMENNRVISVLLWSITKQGMMSPNSQYAIKFQ